MRRSSLCSSSTALGSESSCFSGRKGEDRHLSRDVYTRLFEQSQQPKCNCQAPITEEKDDSDDANCTFAPTVNRTHEELLSRWTEGVSVFERLYGNALFLHRKREQQVRNCLLQKQKEEKEKEERNWAPAVREFIRGRLGFIPQSGGCTTAVQRHVPQSCRYCGETNLHPSTRMTREKKKKILTSPLFSYGVAHQKVSYKN
ncbi:hypothetical protein LSM04_006821 [Trypanosoma melophagium]|uniref:uncharacterized protein n=1 Tax=Trypanosoma melophagium TaxID=715481 RepID=UPI00351A1FF0|nr:hypothetical protein LSM04_006821 [Trypanosoma melophagium]